MSQFTWHPSAELNTLVQRNHLMQALRGYFQSSNSLEVQTPSLSAAGATDPYIDSFTVSKVELNQSQGEKLGACADADLGLWLHTSPEFAMKRLMAAYRIDIHQFATVFRCDESGRHHQREFTLLEWYRVGYGLSDLLDDALALINAACEALKRPALTMKRVSYQDEVHALCGVYPKDVSLNIIEGVFDTHSRSFPDSLRENNPSAADVDAALTLLVDEFIVNAFSTTELTALTEYPASQASLAKLGQHAQGHEIACRAEIFLGSVELANGFEELTDAAVQNERFNNDNAMRVDAGKACVPSDQHLINALRHGLPDCAGMALGIDRLLMVLGGFTQLSEVVAFSDANA